MKVQGAQIFRHRPRLAACAQHINLPVHHLGQVHRALVPAQLGAPNFRPGQRSFRIGQVAGRAKLAAVEGLAAGRLDLRFFAGSRDAPAWSHLEDDATALFCNGSVGELSVRWNPHLRRWLATFNSDNTRGILLHAAPAPWGPWTRRPLRIFDPADGYGKFMHVSWARERIDFVQDDTFEPGQFRDDVYGAEYGPYQIANYAEPAGEGASRIFFTMSTWNPYQACLMTTVISIRDLDHL